MIKVLVTGANGLLGQAVAPQLVTKVKDRSDLLALTRQELDITNVAKVAEVMTAFNPQLVINCAALAAVDTCEREPKRAQLINGQAAGDLAAQAQRLGAAIIHISTDYVFDGKTTRPYTYQDTPHPISVYGQSKLLGEELVRQANPRHYIARVVRLMGLGGNNFGSKIFDIIKRASDNQTKIRVCGYPISQASYIPVVVERLWEIASTGDYGIYHVGGSGPMVAWPEFTQLAAKLMGLNIDHLIELVDYDILGLPAHRPYYSGLRCLKAEQVGLSPLPDWQEGLAQLYQDWCTTQ